MKRDRLWSNFIVYYQYIHRARYIAGILENSGFVHFLSLAGSFVAIFILFVCFQIFPTVSNSF